MKSNADRRGALPIIGNFVVQAAAQSDTASMLEHLAVYSAAAKASKEQIAEGQG